MATKELIKAEIDKIEDEALTEVYRLVKRLADGARERTDEAQATIQHAGPSVPYIGSPRLARRSQAADFVKEVIVEDPPPVGVSGRVGPANREEYQPEASQAAVRT